MAFGNGPRIVTDGLVLALDASDRNSYVSGSTTWGDLGIGGYVGTLTNGPTFSSDSYGSIVFNGTNNYINSPIYPVTAPFSFYTGSFTLDSTVKPTAYQTASYFGLVNMIMIKGNSATTINYATQVTNDTTVTFYKRTNPESLQSNSFTVPSMLNKISNITFTVNDTGTTVTCYFNGSLIGNTTITGTKIEPSPNDTLRFSGISTTGLGTQFIGNIYNTKIYNRALSANEILQNYNTQKSRFNLT